MTRTLDKIQKRYQRPKTKKQVVNYERGFTDGLTKKKTPERPVGLLKPIQVQQPFEQDGMDFIGPFPFLRVGKRYTIVGVDYLTKWVIAQSVPSANPREVFEFFVRRVVLQQKAPVHLISNRGKCSMFVTRSLCSLKRCFNPCRQTT